MFHERDGGKLQNDRSYKLISLITRTHTQPSPHQKPLSSWVQISSRACCSFVLQITPLLFLIIIICYRRHYSTAVNQENKFKVHSQCTSSLHPTVAAAVHDVITHDSHPRVLPNPIVGICLLVPVQRLTSGNPVACRRALAQSRSRGERSNA